MSLDTFDRQALALAVARTLAKEESVPREDQTESAFVRILSGSGGKAQDPETLGYKLLRELDRLGYSVVRQG